MAEINFPLNPREGLVIMVNGDMKAKETQCFSSIGAMLRYFGHRLILKAILHHADKEAQELGANAPEELKQLRQGLVTLLSHTL